MFLKSNVHFVITDGVTLLGSQDDQDYPSLPTRVAGIEMKWPAALININDHRERGGHHRARHSLVMQDASLTATGSKPIEVRNSVDVGEPTMRRPEKAGGGESAGWWRPL